MINDLGLDVREMCMWGDRDRGERQILRNLRARRKYATEPRQRELVKRQARAWYLRGGKAKLRSAELLRRYGLTTAAYAAMFFSQGGVCAMSKCKAMPTDVDHCHATGRVRGLLCKACNIGLGHFERLRDVAPVYLAKSN